MLSSRAGCFRTYAGTVILLFLVLHRTPKTRFDPYWCYCLSRPVAFLVLLSVFITLAYTCKVVTVEVELKDTRRVDAFASLSLFALRSKTFFPMSSGIHHRQVAGGE